MKNPDYEHYTEYKSKKDDNLGNTKNPTKIKEFLEARLKKVVEDIKRIEKDKDEASTRLPPVSQARIITLDDFDTEKPVKVGGGGVSLIPRKTK